MIQGANDFADDYCDDNGFGIGSDYSGLLMLINMDEREMWITTTGSAIDIFTDNRISAMTDAITGLLSNGSYYEACKEFIRRVESYARMGVPRGQHRIDISSQDRMGQRGPPRLLG
ncbi:MAG: TPM domain-containing protein [Clostridia bacterium]